MPDRVNKLRNPDFAEGKRAPRHWVWHATHERVPWQHVRSDRSADVDGVAIIADEPVASAGWSQVVVCRPEAFYRVEATVTCDLSASDDSAGLVLKVQPLVDDQPTGDERWTPALHRVISPIDIRTYFQAPDSIRRLRVSVGLANCAGRAEIRHVRFVEILEPEEMSHLLAVPPPATAVHPPRAAATVCVCADRAADRPITRLLGAEFGETCVQTVARKTFRSERISSDAILMPDPDPPASIRSLDALEDLAAERIVVISLPAFAKLSRGAAVLRRVEQADDPIHAKVMVANHATRGFALHDLFAYAWSGRTPGGFVQNQFRRSDALGKFCERRGYVTLLASMCDREVTSDRPICLYKPTARGGLFVLDIEPAEAQPSTFGEPALAMHVLLSMLGRTQVHAGQYMVPVREEAQFRDLIRETALRFDSFIVHDADVPVEEVTEQLVTIGREDECFGLPLKPKPVILVRSGLTSGDVESVYGAYLWFKQLVRAEPFACPYAQALASQFRLAWVPCIAPWEARGGWRRRGRQPLARLAIQTEGANLAALIDVVSCPINQARVVLPRQDEVFERYSAWLPRLINIFTPGRYFASTVAVGDPFNDRERYEWRSVGHNVRVVVDPAPFTTDIHRDAATAGAHSLRIELPGCDADFATHSIHRTDLAVTLLEQVLGLHYGLIAVNRRTTPVHLDGFPPIGMGEALILAHRDPVLQARMSQAG